VIHRAPLLPVGTALLALLALPSTVRAQEAGHPATEQAAPERGAQGSDADGRGVQARGDGAGTERTPTRDELLARMRAAELEHRERLAAIHTLRELAVRDAQTRRVAQLGELEASENARYQNERDSEARQHGSATGREQTRPGQQIVIRKVRTGARAHGPDGAGAQPRDPSTGRPPDGRQSGTATPAAASDRSGRPRTPAEAAPPSAANRKRSGSGSSRTPR
jgi:hypothetical protein